MISTRLLPTSLSVLMRYTRQAPALVLVSPHLDGFFFLFLLTPLVLSAIGETIQSVLADFDTFQGVQTAIQNLADVRRGLIKSISEKQKVLRTRCDDPMLFYETLVQSDPSFVVSYDTHTFFSSIFNWDDRYNLRNAELFDVFVNNIKHRAFSGPPLAFRAVTPVPVDTTSIPGSTQDVEVPSSTFLPISKASAEATPSKGSVPEEHSPACASDESTAPSSPGAHSTSLDEQSSGSNAGSSDEESASTTAYSSGDDSSYLGSSAASSSRETSAAPRGSFPSLSSRILTKSMLLTPVVVFSRPQRIGPRTPSNAPSDADESSMSFCFLSPISLVHSSPASSASAC